MRALIDYHHADLAESLHLLFEDRLGIEVYLPVGMDWWDNWYWSFGRSYWGDDRLARQFLNQTSVRQDDAHPARDHRCVELTEALDLPWDFVIASVPDNYAGYAKFAQETGAKFVEQVGNANQPIDWGRTSLVLNSSEAQGGYRYHQEFSLVDFHYSEPTGQRLVSSFVNCMASIECWPLFSEAITHPEFVWRIHGIDGRDGNIKPTAAIAEAMRASDWIWHDKVTGDGFGHVIHNAAAVGRPLVGHGRHYAGQLAGPFWQDGATCIDLDRHTVPEAIGLMLNADLPAMSHAIRDRFDEVVDFAAEAEGIAEYLGL